MNSRRVGKALIIISLFACFIRADSQTTLFYFTSSSRSFIGQGQTLLATATNGYSITGGSGFLPSVVAFTIQSNQFMLAITFSTGTNNVAVGSYPNAVRQGGNGSTPGLAFIGNGRGNNTLTGAFTILEVSYTNISKLRSFAADFIQYDEGNSNAWSQGSIRYNSSIPLAKPTIYLSSLDNSVLQLTTSNCPSYQLISLQSTTNFISWKNISTNNISSSTGMVTNMITTTNPATFFRAVIQ